MRFFGWLLGPCNFSAMRPAPRAGSREDLRASIPGYAEHEAAVEVIDREGIVDLFDRQARYDELVGRELSPLQRERLATWRTRARSHG